MSNTAIPVSRMHEPPAPGSWTSDSLHGYGRQVGPIWASAEGRLALRIERLHTNVTGRLQGGMAMGLMSVALARAAHAAARTARPDSRARLLTHHCALVDSVQAGEWVFADVRVARTTRSMVFVTGCLVSGAQRPLMTASAVFQIAADAPRDEVRSPLPATPPPGYAVREPGDAFSAHMAPVYEPRGGSGERMGACRVGLHHMDAHGGDEADAGMALLLAALFLGRHVSTSSGAKCVMAGMGVSRLAPVRLGDLVEFDCRSEGQQGDALVATGRFRVGDQPVMSVTSLWKMLEKK